MSVILLRRLAAALPSFECSNSASISAKGRQMGDKWGRIYILYISFQARNSFASGCGGSSEPLNVQLVHQSPQSKARCHPDEETGQKLHAMSNSLLCIVRQLMIFFFMSHRTNSFPDRADDSCLAFFGFEVCLFAGIYDHTAL